MKKRYQIGLVVIGSLIALIGLSYAYFVATSAGGGKGEETTIETVTIENVGFNIEGMLEFKDLDIYPGHKNISKIKVTALGNNDTINYRLVWEGINSINTPLKYYVYKTNTNEEASITCKKETEQIGASKIYYEGCTNNNFENLGEIVGTGEINKTEEEKEFVLKTNEVIKGTKEGQEIYYYVVLEFPNLEESQNIDMGGKFEGLVTVKKEEEVKSDIAIKNIYQETENGYEIINRIPERGYELNREKSTCTNSATPKLKNNKILITNLTTSGTECNIYLDKDTEKPIITEIRTEVTENTITVIVDATDNNGISEYYYQIDENEVVKGTGNTYTFNNLEAKTTHTIKVYVKDNAGNDSEIETRVVSTIDTTKPTITNVTSTTTMTEISVNVEANDNVGVTEYYYQIDNGEYVKSDSNTYTFNNLEVNSTHTINIYVKDESGNQSDTSTNTIKTKQDEEKPVISNVEVNANETEIIVSVEATDNIGVTEYYYQIDENEVVKENSNTYKFTGLNASTNHIIKVYVKDNAGNESEPTIKSITTLDTTKPTINNVTTSGTETEITVIVDATDNVGVTEYYFAIDNGTFSKSSTNTYKFAGLRAGVTHTIKVYVKDASGNESEITSKSVTTPDTTNPIVENLTTSVTETEINVTVAATDNTEVSEYWYSIDNGTFVKGTGNTHKFTGLSAKTTHTIKAYVKDKFGNQSNTLSASVTTIDSTKPTISKVTSSVTMTEINVTVTASDNVGVTEYWYSIDNGSYVRGSGNTYRFTGLGINTAHTISVIAKDASGNESNVSTNVFVTAQDTVKPTISNVTTTVTKTEINVTVSASDNVGVTEYWYQINGNAPVQGTNTYTFTGLAAGTTYTINVFVKDGAGNQSDITSKSVQTTAPSGSETILGSIPIKPGTPNFANVATTDEGVYSVSDPVYGGTSYYWRGAVNNNYVKFGGFCWRIIRINGDGSIRMIYDGTTCHANGTSTAESIAKARVAYNTSYNQSNYVGWTYSGTSQRTLSGTASNAKTQLESWYNSNLASQASKIADGKYCNDRNIGSGYKWAINGSIFYYAAYNRINTGAPTLSCNSGDVYTLKVGLITADEVEFAGGKNANNTSYYLYNGQYYWAMSPYWWNGSAVVFGVNSNGHLTGVAVNSTWGLRPVINLKADTLFAAGGNGTQSNPYVVS